MEPSYINNQRITELLPMKECIEVMQEMFLSLAEGKVLQPLRSVMWLPDKRGLLGMMPGYAEGPGMMGIKIISVFHGNSIKGYPSHQGVVVLFDVEYGKPLMILDADEITAIRTAAASAVATRVLARQDAENLTIIGSGVQAKKHIEAITLVRDIKQITIWSRQEKNAAQLADEIREKYYQDVMVTRNAKEAVENADIICTVTSSVQPILQGEWLKSGTHINAIGSSTPVTREIATNALLHSSLFTDNYESLFNEAGDFIIPEKEGAITKTHVKAEIGEVIAGKKQGRTGKDEITLYKSLGIAAEDIYSAWHIYRKVKSSDI